MPISIPDLGAKNCIFFSACMCYADVPDKEKVLEWMRDHRKPYVYKYPDGSFPVYVHAFYGEEDDGLHVHSHISTDLRYLTNKHDLERPIDDDTVNDITYDQIVQPFIGLDGSARITSDFLWAEDDIPSTISSLIRLKADNGGISMRLVSGLFVIENSPLLSIGWEYYKDNKTTKVSFQMGSKITTSDSYLAECFKLMDAATNALNETTGGQ